MTRHILSLLIALSSYSNAEQIEIFSKTGKTMKVEVLDYKEGEITVLLGNGKKMTTSTEPLSEDSLNKIKELWAKKEEMLADAMEDKDPEDNSPEDIQSLPINKAIGHALFNNAQLWESSAEVVAKRLNWQQESSTADSSSYRKYPKPDYTFLGARPYSAVLYGNENNKVVSLSIVFANKGDFHSTVGRAEEHFKKTNNGDNKKGTLEDAIDSDIEKISQTLSAQLGEPVKQRFGERGGRTTALRWDYHDHSFILAKAEEEYVRLLIVTKEIADAQGKEKFISDIKLKKMLIKNVISNEFGDTLIHNIPMVDQGAKSYCAPATFERVMRYMRVPADMYILATLATLPEGGTNTTKLAEESKNILRSKARRIKDFDSKDIKIRDVKKYIDKGVPIMWRMRSLTKYNDIANKRTDERENVTDQQTWANNIAEEAISVAPKMEKMDEKHHICMIIGYNEATNELAVSDSWGPRYALRWVHFDLVNAVSSDGSFVIDY